MRNVFLRLAALLALLLAQCNLTPFAGGAGAGNPPLADVAVALKANSLMDTPLPKAGKVLGKAPGEGTLDTNGTFTVRDTSGAAFTLTGIQVSVRRIEFALPDGIDCGKGEGVVCGNGIASVTGLFSMDLMTGKSNPALGRIRLPQGLYKSVKLTLDEGAEGHSKGSGGSGSTSESTFVNMVIKGHTDSAGGPVGLFALKLDLLDGLVFEKPEGLRIGVDSLNTVLMQLTVDGWLKGVRMQPCLESPDAVPDSSGMRVLTGDVFCGGEGRRIRRNIEGSGEIGLDEDDIGYP